MAAHIEVNLAVNLDVPTETIVERISNRWIHPASGRVYAYDYNPPKEEGVDDETGEPLVSNPICCSLGPSALCYIFQLNDLLCSHRYNATTTKRKRFASACRLTTNRPPPLYLITPIAVCWLRSAGPRAM